MAESIAGMANIYAKRGDDSEAEKCYQQALAIRLQQLGSEHPDTAQTLASMAALHSRQGNLEEARSQYHQALTIQEQRLGNQHPETLKTRAQYDQLMQPIDPDLQTVQLQASNREQRDNL